MSYVNRLQIRHFTNKKEVCIAIAPGMDAPVSQWPIFPTVPSNGPEDFAKAYNLSQFSSRF